MSHHPHRLALALGLVALVISGAGCGGRGDESTSVATEQAPVQAREDAEVLRQNEKVRKEYRQRQEAQAPTPEERQAERTATDFYATLAEDEAPKDPKRTSIDTASCDLMSERAVAQTIHYAEVSSGLKREWDCDSAVELLILRSKEAGGFQDLQQAKVIGVNVAGERATATIQFGDAPVTAVPLVRENGEWKLAASAVPSAR